jgi:ABC-2 type transport system permease protein
VRAFVSIVRVTTRQVVGGRRWIVLSLLALLPPVVMWFSSLTLTPSASIDRYNDAPLPTLLLLVVPIVTLVVGSGALGDERRDGTLSFLLVRPVRRATIVSAKLAAAFLAAAAIAGMGGALASFVLALRADTWVTFAPTLTAVLVGTAAYTAVFMILGHLTSRAVLIGLVYVFVWESGISFAAPALANVSISRLGLSAYVGLLPESTPGFGALTEVLGVLEPGAGGAVAKAAGITLVCVLIGAFLLQRLDATSE